MVVCGIENVCFCGDLNIVKYCWIFEGLFDVLLKFLRMIGVSCIFW